VYFNCFSSSSSFLTPPPLFSNSSGDEESFATAVSSLPSAKKGRSSAAPSKGKGPAKKRKTAVAKKPVLAAGRVQVVCGRGDEKVTGLLDLGLLLAAAAEKRKGDVIQVGDDFFSISAFEAMGGLGHQRHPRHNVRVVVGVGEDGGDDTVTLDSFIKENNLEFPEVGKGKEGKGKRVKKE
jgi:hypothetical protein